MKKIAPSTYKQDKYYEGVARAVHEILQEKSSVAPVDVFIQMGKLSKEDYENWRFKRVPDLEKVLNCNLSKANRILRILKRHAEAIGLKAERAAYMKWGKGGKRIPLRFSKYGEPNVEASYSTHYVTASSEQWEKFKAPAENGEEVTMTSSELFQQISKKKIDKEKIAAHVIRNPELLPAIFEGLGAEEANLKYGCDKILRIIGRREPSLLYSKIDFFISNLQSQTTFLKWSAIDIIANLAAVDSDKKFEEILDRYFAPILGQF